jgi:two-component system, OmpR family, alkaline phosphatase synthesis response regulator PhoP
MTGRKVLVVDDEIHIVHVVTIKLRNNGYEVISAENGADALELARKERPEVIISDFQMPVLTGMDLVERLRQYEETRDIPVIMLTARSFDIPAEQQQRLHIVQCLSKPFSPRELLGCVEDALCVEGRV